MQDVVIIESDPALRGALRTRFAALEERVAMARDPGEARVLLVQAAGRGIVVARGTGRAADVDALAEQLPSGAGALAQRMLVVDPGDAAVPRGRGACPYLLEIERVVAALLFPAPDERASSRPHGPWKEWPGDLYEALEVVRWAETGRAVLAHDRMTGALSMVSECAAGNAGPSWLRARIATECPPWTEFVRYDIRGARRFVAARVPQSLAAARSQTSLAA